MEEFRLNAHFLSLPQQKPGKYHCFTGKFVISREFSVRGLQFGSLYRKVRYTEVRYTEGMNNKKKLSENSGIRRKFAISRGSLYRRYVISRVDCIDYL